jgi:hypothetical protein
MRNIVANIEKPVFRGTGTPLLDTFYDNVGSWYLNFSLRLGEYQVTKVTSHRKQERPLDHWGDVGASVTRRCLFALLEKKAGG